MKKIILILLALLLNGLFSHDALSEQRVPYGTFCPLCSPYGACRKELATKKAVKIIKAYFNDMGLDARIIEARGRFIKADIYKNGIFVDKIIFDKKTGRIRSIY